MSYKMPGLVEHSSNLGVIRTEGDSIVYTFMFRSGINAQLDQTCAELEALAELCGATVEYNERYGGWDFAEKSPLRDSYAAAYAEVTGVAPKIESIHAGLECGFIIDNIPDMDIISVGPNEVDIHSPDERLELSSVETLWQVVEKVLAK
jgi:dipeptidase D